MTDLALLRHFVVVAKARNFTLAAKKLNSSQSVVSRSIKRLEDQIGIQLINRSTRSVVLTAAGMAFLKDANIILDRLAVASDHARRIGLGTFAELRIGICPSTETSEIVEGITRFRNEWPDLALSFHAISSTEQPQALRSSIIDVGIMQGGGTSFEELQWRVIKRHHVLIAVPGNWMFDPGSRIDLAQLSDRPWIVPDKIVAPIWHEGFMHLCNLAGFAPKIVATADDPMTTRIMISCGMGASFSHDRSEMHLGSAITLLHFDTAKFQSEKLAAAETVVAWSKGSATPQIDELVNILAKASSLREK